MENPSVAVSQVPSPQHTYPGHPESPVRFQFIDFTDRLTLNEHLLNIPPTPAAKEQLAPVHTEAYLQRLEITCRQGTGFLDYGDTFTGPESWESALLAAGSTLAVLDAVLDGRAQRGFAIIRPPGHHATKDQAMGFCLLNNIAIATRHCQAWGKNRVMIIDFDVHHGNGTQAIFDADSDVLYLSTHQYGIFPGTGSMTETGIGPGTGSSVNVPLPAYCGDQAFKSIMEEIIQPICDRFQPEMLLVSAGFDAHWKDPLANLSVSTAGYSDITRGLVELADRYTGGKLIYVLEGGYDPHALAESIGASLDALCGLSQVEQLPRSPTAAEPDLSLLLRSIREIHSLTT